MPSRKINCPCGQNMFKKVYTYTEPPEGEISFQFSSKKDYLRELLECGLCGHFVSTHEMDANGMYEGDYVSSTYGDEEGILAAFKRIISLPPEKSDNTGRANRILRFADSHSPAKGGPDTPRSILDVGSGLCVFLYLMKKAGWDGTALDPDPRCVSHAREAVGVKAVCGDFPRLEKDIGRFDAIAFNRVLEHVEDPVSMLAASGDYLNGGGFVYVEVPDGECAISEGPGREEFFIDHFHVFSAASLALLAGKAGFTVVEMERLREPSSKFTLRAFLTKSKEI